MDLAIGAPGDISGEDVLTAGNVYLLEGPITSDVSSISQTAAATLSGPGVSSLTSKRAQTGQGSAMGLNNSFMSLGRVVGPALAGVLFDVNLTFPYILGSILTFIGFILCLFLLKPARPQLDKAAASQSAK